jgi:hypothetical protein
MKSARALISPLLAALLLAGCVTEKTAVSDTRCPEDSSSLGLSIPSGFGVTIGDAALKAAFSTIRDYFRQRPAATGPADKAQAAELAAEAAAKTAGQPMNDDQKRELRSQASQWVETYTEKCKPAS